MESGIQRVQIVLVGGRAVSEEMCKKPSEEQATFGKEQEVGVLELLSGSAPLPLCRAEVSTDPLTPLC